LCLSDKEIIVVEELVKLVVQKTGLAQGTAIITVSLVISYLRDKLPDPVVAQIDDLLGGDKTVEIMNHYLKRAGKELGEE
jgi:hypothetical protein